MTRIQAKITLKHLSEHFGIPVPTLRWRRRRNRSSYVRKSHTIWLAPCPWRGAVDSLLHEFAHALTEKRDGEIFLHGYYFKKSLLDVASLYYGDPKRYGWHTEYEDVYRFGVEQLGLANLHLHDYSSFGMMEKMEQSLSFFG